MCSGGTPRKVNDKLLSCPCDMQHAMNHGWLQDTEGKASLVSLLSSAREASLGMAQLHREDIIHGAVSPAACFLKAARNQRGFIVKVSPLACLSCAPCSRGRLLCVLVS